MNRSVTVTKEKVVVRFYGYVLHNITFCAIDKSETIGVLFMLPGSNETLQYHTKIHLQRFENIL